jgi:AraC-like DNA-binding protein
MSRLLEAFTIVNTRRVEEMRGVLASVYDARSFDVCGDQSLFSAKAAYFDLGSTALSFCTYGCPVRIELRNGDYLRIQVCVAGTGRTSKPDSAVDVSPTAIVCSSMNTTYEFDQSYEQLVLKTNRAALERELTALLGSRPKDQLSFDMAASCEAAQTRRLRAIILNTVSSIDISHEPIPPPLLREMDQTIRLAILYGMPNNFTNRLLAKPKASAPWQVRLVEEWIDAHWQEDISVDRFVDISGASLRSIFSTFRSARGYTPMAYLKQVRLNAAREMLLKAEPGASVTGIAFACNFLNPSHFARDYERRFDELPSETLRRARVEAL